MKKIIGIAIIIFGFFLCIFTHELYHYCMHKDTITSIRIFPDWNTPVNIRFKSKVKIDPLPEELIAYTISTITFSAATYIGLPKIIKK